MSLINDALKKTQRMRSDPADSGPMTGGYAGPRGRSSSGPSVMLMVIGGIVLVAVAIGGTVLLLKFKSSSTATVAAAPADTAPAIVPAAAPIAPSVNAPANNLSGPAPTLVVPVINVPKAEPSPTPAAVVASAAPAQTPELTAAPPATAANPAVNPAAKAKVDVATFIDAIHVTGVRFSEGGSKVLMNDHVYKVNDVVERVLNIKLIEVGTDSLTFIDENGAVYKKSF